MKSSPSPLPALAQTTPLQQALAGVWIATAAVLLGTLGVRAVGVVDLRHWWVPLSFVSGVAAADLTSAVVHWAADPWGRADLPVIGPRFLVPFRVHHLNPDDFIHRRFVETVISRSTGARPRADEDAFAAGSRHANSGVRLRV